METAAAAVKMKLFDAAIVGNAPEAMELMANILESSTEYSIIGKDLDGKILLWNEGARRLYGYEPEEVVGRASSSILHTEEDVQAGKPAEILEAALAHGKWEGTIQRRRKDGEVFTARVVITPRRGRHGQAIGYLLISKDISDEIRLTDQLRSTQLYTRSLIESNIDALMTTDPLGIISDVNRQMVTLTGYTREELIGSRFKSYFTDPGRAEDGIKQVLREGQVTNYELTALAKTGRMTVVSYNASTFRDADGRLQGVFAAARDITEQKELERQLRESEAYNRGLIEASVDGLVTVNPMLDITDVNDTMCRMAGYSRQELIGKRFPSYFTDPKRAAAGVRLTLDRGAVTSYQLTLLGADGRERVVALNAAIFRDEAGAVRGVFASARDSTEQTRLQEQLAEERAYVRGLFEASVDGLVTVDQAMVITDVNETMCRMAGRRRSQLIGSSFPTYFAESDRAAEGVLLTFRQRAVTNYVLTLQAADRRQFPVSFNAAVFTDAAGKVRGIFASARDITAQKGLESQLQASELYTRTLFESNIDALMTTDPLGVVTDVNEQMELLTGRAREELVGTPFKTFFTDPGRAEDGIELVLREGKVQNYELTARTKEGKETVISYNATTFADRDGKLRGVFAAARDITEQKELERQLRESQAYNRGLIEASVDGLVTVDPEGFISDVNDRICQLSGYTRAELLGAPFADYFTDAERARAGVRKTFEQGVVTDYALTLVTRTRRLLQVSFNASVFRDPSGNVRGIFASARDITDRLRLEEQLREQQTYLRGLIESSVDGLVTVDPEGYITDVNEQLCRMTRYSREALVGSAFKSYFTEPGLAEAGVRLTLAEGAVTNYELVLRTKTGPKATVSFNASVFRDADGLVQGIFASARDISEQARLQAQLVDQQAYNRSLIEASADALFAIAPDGVVIDVNEEATRLTGYSRKHLVNSRFPIYFTEPEQAYAGVQHTLAAGRVLAYELMLITRHGRRIPVSLNAGVFSDAAGKPLGVLAAARDIAEQKNLTQQLRDQQTYSRSLIESNIDALMTTDPLGTITDVNEQMCRVTGSSRAALVGTPFRDYVTDPARAEDGIRRVLADGKVINYELTIRSREGKETVVSYNATTFTGADGKLHGVFAAARDVSAQKALEYEINRRSQQLTEATTFLHNILESSTEYSIIAKDLEGTILTWNEGARRTYGYSAEEMVGKINSRVLHTPEDIESGRADAALATALYTGKFEGELLRVRKNGQRFSAHVAITLRRDATGTPIGYVLISKDISAQKVLEEQLRRKNDELETQNRRIEQTNRMKSEFLANMSHELRTPLNGIIGFAELIHAGKAGPVSEMHHEYLGDILTSARHLLQLVNDVLDLAKVESGKIELRAEPLQLDHLVGEVRDVLRAIASKKRIRLEAAVDPAVREVVGDPSRIKQILYNFLSNALKFTAEEGRVTVRCLPEGAASFRLEVQDTGIGIHPDDMGRLFVEFQQLDGSSAKRFQGTGLGLALTRRLAEACGGRVEVQSQVGVGSTFAAVLPRRLGEQQEEAGALVVAAQRGGPAILVVEDDRAEREWLVRALDDAGYGVVAVGSGKEALQVAADWHFAAITLDLLLPDMSGWELLAAVRATATHHDLAAVVVTVAADAKPAPGHAIAGILRKPATAEELIAALCRAGVPAPATVLSQQQKEESVGR